MEAQGLSTGKMIRPRVSGRQGIKIARLIATPSYLPPKVKISLQVCRGIWPWYLMQDSEVSWPPGYSEELTCPAFSGAL